MARLLSLLVAGGSIPLLLTGGSSGPAEPDHLHGATAPTTRGATLPAPLLANASFETSAAGGAPAAWDVMGGEAYEARVDEATAWEGERSVRLEKTGEGADFGGLVQIVEPGPFHGHGLVLTGRIRTRGVTEHGALWVRVDAGSHMLSLDNMEDRGPSGDTEWAPFTIRMPVPPNATRIMVGVLQVGSGASWYDALELRADSAVIAEEAELPELGPPDTTLAEADPAAVASVRSTAWPLRSLTDTRDFSDLAFLGEAIGGRRVVQLGESGHGVKQFNQAKVRLIRYLHEALGFDVVAFESSLFECWNGWRHADSLSAEGLMEHCIFSVWHADETLALFEYILETRKTDRPLILAGFDTQTSSSATPERLRFWTELLEPLNPERAARTRELDSTFVAIHRDGEALAERADELLVRYRELASWLGEHEDDLRALHSGDPERVGMARRLAASADHHIRQLTLSGGVERTVARDEGMAENLLWLMNQLYPDRKIITWGHNFHLRHTNEEVEGNGVKTMGQWVAEARRDDLYTVGLYMRRGRAAMNNREVYNVEPAPAGSVEAILGNAAREMGAGAVFADLHRTGAAEGGGWVREMISTLTWGQGEVRMVPVDQYDAILLVDEVSPPDYR